VGEEDDSEHQAQDGQSHVITGTRQLVQHVQPPFF
jgi:hypothetical protein